MISAHEMTRIIEDTLAFYGVEVDVRTVRQLAAATASRATEHATARYSQGYAAGRHDGATDGPPLLPLQRDHALRDRIANLALLLPAHGTDRLARVRHDLLVALRATPDAEDLDGVSAAAADPLLADALADVLASHTGEDDHGADYEYATPAIEDPDVVAALIAWSDARHAQPGTLLPQAGTGDVTPTDHETITGHHWAWSVSEPPQTPRQLATLIAKALSHERERRAYLTSRGLPDEPTVTR